ncbi:MAG: hypothetical protein KQJ78_02060 [Deltaproteobacteria bacterium]|nr:hypothetical protein [Deltaproteobacteria bacterium]
MKIDNNILLNSVTAANRLDGRDSGNAGPSFSQVLAGVVNPEEQTASIGSVKPASAAAEVAEVDASQACFSPLWEKLDGLVNSLEVYSTALGDSRHTLKQVEPLVKDLASRSQAMEEELNAAPDDELSGLGWQAVTQAKVEIIKFQRGDYV